jgi:hypothetical protein
MLVKFKIINGQPRMMDSSKIYYGNNLYKKHWIYEYGNNSDAFEIDDPTLAYLQNAWAHEGMRRVLYSAPVPVSNIPNDTVVHNNKGWYFEKDVYNELGKLVGKAKDLNIRFIPYEMEV